LVCSTFYFWFGIQKIQKDFALFVVSFCSCFKFEKPKIFVVIFRFCKVVAEFIGLHGSIGACLSLHIIQATQVKGNNDDY
jgi:hypothetical protein